MPVMLQCRARREVCGAGIAVETALMDYEDDTSDIELLESRVPLQRITLTIPADLNVANLQFVMRSNDGSMWYRDGGSNFTVPVPGVPIRQHHSFTQTTSASIFKIKKIDFCLCALIQICFFEDNERK